MRRIGIFRGTFDPIHDGHIAFALKAIEEANLECLYFLPEPNPLHKQGVSDFEQRLTLIAQKIRPHKKLLLLNQDNLHGNIGQIIQLLKEKFGSSTLVFLMGSDVAKTLPQWSDLDLLCKDNEIIVALRGLDKKNDITKIIDSLKLKPIYTLIVPSPLPDMSSSIIRKEISQSSL